MIFSDPVCDDAPSQAHSTERECESCKFYKFLEFTEFLRILKILTNFKNKIRYREKLQIGRKSLTQTY